MIIYKLPECEVVEKLPEGCALALGNFDGVHRGHQLLFELAGETGLKCASWTFTTLVKPGLTVPYITDMKAKLSLFAYYGLDYAVFEDFESIRNMSCEDFAHKYLIENFNPARVCCGFNFSFGAGGVGDAELLRSLLTSVGVDVGILSPVIRRGKIVSSSAVRVAVMSGDMDGAYDLMGHAFAIKFPVKEGNRLGRTIGIPTINQYFPDGHIVPKIGIYACTVGVRGKVYIGVTNIGLRPTVASANLTVNSETHIIDFEGDLYGEEIEVRFYERLRDEIKFDSVEALAERIRLDIADTREFFARLYGG